MTHTNGPAREAIRGATHLDSDRVNSFYDLAHVHWKTRRRRGVCLKRRRFVLKMTKIHLAVLFLFAYALLGIVRHAFAQQASGSVLNALQSSLAKEVSGQTNSSLTAVSGLSELSERERILLDRIEQLEKRVADLEARLGNDPAIKAIAPVSTKPAATLQPPETVTPSQLTAEDRGPLDFLRDTSINLTLDGYYGYNFNRPVGRINLLRAYDVLSNSFSLNQAAVIVERSPNAQAGRRFGARLDLQYGQATETLQGSASNELRPQVYRPIFQAYGTYILPVGSGLTVDFGKWASALGFENNYTKDQMNYSRSYLYNFLPFYHFGLRTSYNVTNWLNVTHWVVNGANQSEDFNGSKSQALLLTMKPTRSILWNVNYYTGIEGRDTKPALNPGLPTLATQPGLSVDIIRPAPRGRLHILDTYAAWNATRKLTLAAEADEVINRLERFSPPSRVTGGAAYARYRLTPRFALAARAEYLSDRGGLFSGLTQALKETTLTADYSFADGFLVRSEWRRDFSNRPFFLTRFPDVRKHEQNTATVGLIWWFGRKGGVW